MVGNRCALLDDDASVGPGPVLRGLQFAYHGDEFVGQRIGDVTCPDRRFVKDLYVDQDRIGFRTRLDVLSQLLRAHIEVEFVDSALSQGLAHEQFGVGEHAILGEAIALVDLG